jgi:TRAP-type C4-dicarboxylate transport system permease small subunit
MQYVEKMLKHLVVTGIGLMLVIVFVQVITRYCFNYTPSFAEELSRYLFVWVVFLALPLVAKSGGHMAIETITSRLSGVKLKVARVLADIATMAFLALMTMEGVRMVEISHFQTSPAMLLPMSYVYVVIPFGCAVMLVNVARHFIDLLRTAAHEVK